MYKFFVSYSYKDANGLLSFDNTSFELSYRRPYMSDIKAFEEIISRKNPDFSNVRVINCDPIHS